MIITSFNILADVFIDFKNPEIYYPTIKKEMLKMKHRFNTLIKYIHGDIIMLQEVTPYIRNKIISIFGDKYIVLPLSVHISTTETTGNLTLLKRNKFGAIQYDTLYINNTAVSVTSVKSDKSDKSIKSDKSVTYNDDIAIYNIHLNDVSHDIRMKELKHIISTFDKTKKIIIGGDFNSDNKKLHHLLKDFKIGIQSKSTYLCEDPMIDCIYVYGFKKAIGYVDNKINSKNCFQATIEKYGSDHYPVYTTLI